jgi:hypothetical protein
VLSLAKGGGGGDALRQHVRGNTILYLNLDDLSARAFS